MPDEITFFDAFAGIGGIRKGLEEASPRFKCIEGCEYDRNPRYIYHKRFSHWPMRDITQIDERFLPDFDILAGGFPCQAFSNAGRRMGFEDTRGTLFFDLARIAKEKQPSLLLFENVKGLLNHDQGRTFETILNTMDELGYDAEWRVLNSKDWVPQNRERLFIIGHSRKHAFKKIFPITEGEGVPDSEGTGKTRPSARIRGEVSTIDSRYGALRNAGETYLIVADRTRSKQKLGRNLESPSEISKSLTSVPKDNLLIMLSHTKANMKKRVQKKDAVWCLDTTGSKQGIIQPKLKQIDQLYEKNTSVGRIYDSKNGLSKTLLGSQGGMGKATGLYQVNDQIRRLTPLECERLQGFPDGWTSGLPDTIRYQCLGNAVTVPVIKYIGQRILEAGIFG